MSPFSHPEDRRPPPQEEPLVRIILDRLLTNPKKGFVGLSIILVTVVLFYFSGSKTPTEPQKIPVIKALPGPSRLKPENAQHPVVPHQDRHVYKNIEKTPAVSKVEHLLPPAEAPLSFEEDLKEEPEKAPFLEEKKEEPESIQSIDQLLGRTPQASAAPMIQKGGKYRLQVGSLPTREAAEQEWSRIQRIMKEPAFARLKPLFERVDLGAEKGGIIYRIILENIASKESAKTLETRLKDRKISCLVIAP